MSHTALLLPLESGVWISANDVRLETGQGYSGLPQHEGIYTDTFWGWMDIPALRLLHLQCMDICGYSTSTSQAQTWLLFIIAACASVWHSHCYFFSSSRKKVTWMQPFPKSVTDLSCLWKDLCLYKCPWQPEAAKASRCRCPRSKHQEAVAGPGFGAELGSLTQLGPIWGIYCTISPNALKWASLVHFPQGLQSCFYLQPLVKTTEKW